MRVMERRNTAERTRIQRLRRWATDQGLTLRVSRRQTPGAADYDRWYLGATLPDRPSGAEYTLTLDEVEAYLRGDEDAVERPA